MSVDKREQKGQEIANTPNQIRRIDSQTYMVNSQSGNGFYEVLHSPIGWLCNCPDAVYRGVRCKHAWAVEISQAIRKEVQVRRIAPLSIISNCIFCNSYDIVKFGIRRNKHGDIQKFKCENCSRFFTFNIGFERMKHNPQAVTTAMQLYFSGESLRRTAESLKLIGSEVTHQTIYNWIRKYTKLMQDYVAKLKPNVGDTWRADELWVKVKGDMKYLFALMDDETRFWIAQEVADTKYKHDARSLFHKGKEAIGKRPMTVITDGLPAYRDAFNKEFFTLRNPRSKHINAIKLSGDMNNNKMERLNGEIRDREKVFRGLKVKDTPILLGYQIFHNYIRPHEALDGKTPSEACGIKVEGENKWLTLIQNAYQTNFDTRFNQTTT